VGYRQLGAYLAGEYDLAEATEKALAATRQLAKRQLTWLRKWPSLQWLYTDEGGNLLPESGSDQNREQSSDTPLMAALRYLDQPRV